MKNVRIARPEEDAAAVAAIYATYVSDTVISFEEVPPTVAEMTDRIRRILRTHPFLVFEKEGEIVAYAYASPHAERSAYRWSCDVAIYAAGQVHGRGIGRTLYTELLGLLKRQGFHMAYGGVTLPNDKSVGLHEAMGFYPIGQYKEVGFKHGAWRDVGWWACCLSVGQPEGDPIPFPELIGEAP